APRLGKEQGGEAEQKPWRARDEEGRAPSERGAERAAEGEAQRRSHRERGVEERHHPAAALFFVAVGDQTGGDRGVACLADADQTARQKQLLEGAREAAVDRGRRPQEDRKSTR